MHYKTEELEAIAIKAIKEHKLVFIDEVCTYLPVARQTFYNHKLDKMDSIKDLLESNKIDEKKELRSKWRESENATTQIALYKLLSSEPELKKLSGQYHDHTTGGDKLSALTSQDLDKKLDELNGVLGASEE